MQDALATQSAADATLSPHEAAFYGSGARLVAPESYSELEDIVRGAESKGTALIPAGLGAHAYLGNPPAGDALVVSLRKLNRILRYEPGDFTLGVQAGLPLVELRSSLEANNQEIPIDLPALARGTVGGLIAAAQPGLRRGRQGPLRAFVIGVHALRGGPSRYKTGGMVVKNVAGYEVMKLLAGSLGTTGLIQEVNLKLRPIPERRVCRVALFADRGAAWRFAEELRTAHVETAALWILNDAARSQSSSTHEALSGAGHLVLWLFEGMSSRVAWQESQAESILDRYSPASRAAVSGGDLDQLTDFLSGFDSPGIEPRDGLGIARLSALPTRASALEDVAGRIVTDSGFLAQSACDVLSGLVTLRWSAESVGAGRNDTRQAQGTSPQQAGEGIDRPVDALRRALVQSQSTGTLLYLPPGVRSSHEYWITPDPNAPVARRLLKALDPHGVFCPGRLLGPE